MLNMNKEYRNEIREIKARELEIRKNLKFVATDANKAIADIERTVAREGRLATKQLQRIGKRRAVLKGRLS